MHVIMSSAPFLFHASQVPSSTTRITYNCGMGKYLIMLPPQFSQRLRQFRIVKLRILIRQFSSSRLRPHHESVHGPFHVQFPFVRGSPEKQTTICYSQMVVE